MAQPIAYAPITWFVAVLFINAAGLAVDAILKLHGHATVTDYVRAHPAWGIPIVALQFIGAYTLAAHFWGLPFPEK